MSARPPMTRLKTAEKALTEVETDPAHHLTGPFLPQTPLDGSPVPSRVSSPVLRKAPSSKAGPSFWADLANGQWVINPASSFKLVCGSLAAFLAWEALAPAGAPNPLAPLLLLSHRVPASAPGDARYQKGYLDLVFVAYYVVVWSFVRQTIIVTISRRLARRFGIRSVAKRERFGEQLYAMVYFAFFGIWGIRIMGQLPTWWYQTEHFFLGYPEWNMKPELKRYYLMHGAYWTQQAVVMLFGLEKPRKDYYELIAHHAVTLHLIGWSYLVSMTFMGQAVYMSMDIPDAFLAASKLLNYMRFERAKTVMFAVLIPTWTYFRIYLNVIMLSSVWNQFELAAEHTRQWSPKDGVWLAGWMKYQMFWPLLVLLGLNLFWYFLILRIAKRALLDSTLEDERSDDEGDGAEDDEKEE